MYIAFFATSETISARTANSLIKKVQSHVCESGATLQKVVSKRYGVISFFEVHQVAVIELQEQRKERREVASFCK
jgi:hypothetical protein